MVLWFSSKLYLKIKIVLKMIDLIFAFVKVGLVYISS